MSSVGNGFLFPFLNEVISASVVILNGRSSVVCGDVHEVISEGEGAFRMFVRSVMNRL